LSIGLLSLGNVPENTALALAHIVGSIVSGGGTVVVAENSSLLDSRAFVAALGWSERAAPSLAYGEARRLAGLHVMATPTDHAVETLTGLGGTGVQLILAHVQ